MKFHEFGDKNLPPILLIHCGGSSWWNYLRQARILSGEYRVILPTLNGHGEEYQLAVSYTHLINYSRTAKIRNIVKGLGLTIYRFFFKW